MVNGGTPSSARRPLTSRATIRSSEPSASRACRAVAQAAEPVVARPQPEPERRCVARGQRDGGDERERPWQPRAFGRCGGAPRALVDEQRVGMLGVDRGGEVGGLVAGAFAELAQPRHEPPATPTHTEHETRIPIGA